MKKILIITAMILTMGVNIKTVSAFDFADLLGGGSDDNSAVGAGYDSGNVGNGGFDSGNIGNTGFDSGNFGNGGFDSGNIGNTGFDSGNIRMGSGGSNSASGGGLGSNSSSQNGIPKLSLMGIVAWLVGIMNQLVYVIIGAALVAFLYGILKLSFIDGQKPEAREQARKFMFWGIVSLFVMMSVWGLVNIFKFTLFGPGDLIIPRLK